MNLIPTRRPRTRHHGRAVALAGPALARTVLTRTVVVSTVLATLVAAGCSSSGGSSSAPPSATSPSGQAASGQKVTLSFWTWVPNMDKVVAIWNKAHPDALGSHLAA